MTSRHKQTILGLSCLLALSTIQAAKPVWSFFPKTPVKLSMRSGENAEIRYLVHNNSSRPKALIMQPLPGITQINPCKLPGMGECTLTLSINGSALQNAIKNGPILCEAANPNQCYQPAKKDALDIEINSSSPPPMIAAGYYGSNTIEAPLLAQSNNGGKTWSYRINASSPTLPAGLMNGMFRGSNCSGMNCIAAGTYYNGGGNFPLLAHSGDGGLTWSYRITSSSPTLPPGLVDGNFYSAHCSNLNCIAAGYYYTGLDTFPLLAQSNDGGINWSYRIDASSPSLPTNFIFGNFSSARCYSSQCLAAGFYSTGGAITDMRPLLAHSNDGGTTWIYRIDASTPTPPINLLGGSLSDVSCSGKNCVTTGTFFNGSIYLPLIMQSTNGGINWMYRPAPALPLPGSNRGFLTSVSCDGQNCVAAGGSSADTINNFPLLAYSKNGGANWTYRITATTPSPPIGFIHGVFFAASCSELNCIAAGFYSTAISTYPLLAHSNDGGMNWTYRIDATRPVLSSGLFTGFFSNASCNGLNCIAAGEYADNSTPTLYPLLALSKDGGKTWAYKITANYPVLPAGFTIGSFNTSNAGSASYLPASLNFINTL